MAPNQKSAIQKFKSNRKKTKKREDLASENPKGDIYQLILLIGFIGIMIIDNFIFHWFQPIHNLLPWYFALLIGAPFLITAGLLAKNGLSIVFGEIREPPCVITKGSFRFSRHPIYLGSLMVYFGISLASLSVIGLLYFIITFFFYNYIAKYEEGKLIQKFSTEYEDYMKKVPRWIKIPFK
ncbi:MAG: methyltransferase family protein [Promethearchaeota archaeon]